MSANQTPVPARFGVATAMALLAGVGIANLPQVVVKDELADGRLIAVLPEWQPAEGVITAVFPSRRGLMPSVRSLIDFLGGAFEAP